jgi:hypothetical protein
VEHSKMGDGKNTFSWTDVSSYKQWKSKGSSNSCQCLQIFFFSTITEGLKLQVRNEDPISFLKDAFPVKFPDIKIITTTETEIKSIMHSLKSKNSPGYDEITSKILKTCSDLISCPLTHICNYSLHTGIFPDHLKIFQW